MQMVGTYTFGAAVVSLHKIQTCKTAMVWLSGYLFTLSEQCSSISHVLICGCTIWLLQFVDYAGIIVITNNKNIV